MDAKLLSAIVKDLLSDRENVVLDGIGTFSVEEVPASFSDRGFTLNPPYCRIAFHQSDAQDGANRLLDCYCASNDVDRAKAQRVLTDFLIGLKAEICDSKSVVLPGLGRLRATRENNIFFVQDPDLALFPEYDLLEPVSLKSLSSIAPAEEPVAVVEEPVAAEPVAAEPVAAEPVAAEPVAAVVEPVTAVEEQPVAEQPAPEEPAEQPAAEEAREEEVPAAEEVVEETAEKAEKAEEEKPKKEKKAKKKMSGWAVTFIVLIVLGGLALGALAVVGRMYPQIVDPLLYNAEELEILNTNI